MKARLAAALATAASLFAGILVLPAGTGPIGSLVPFAAAETPAPTSAPATAPLPPTRVTGLPARTISDGATSLEVALSAPVSPTSPTPTLVPAVAGAWHVAGDLEVFTPAASLAPCSSYQLIMWAQTDSTGHAELAHRRTLTLQVACPPLTGLQLALSRLGYLGASFHPRHALHIRSGRLSGREAALLLFGPPAGTLVPDPSSAPPLAPGQLDATTRGALEVFQADNGLAVSGQTNRAVWLALLSDLRTYRRDRQPYTWATVSEQEPETLYLHRGQQLLLTTLVNTGVPGAETQTGIFPIYARYVSTTMAGEDPDGTKYDVPDVPWVNYFNGGDAVHGYPREAYGFPQSNGCVELPIEAARWVFGALAIGDIVWVR